MIVFEGVMTTTPLTSIAATEWVPLSQLRPAPWNPRLIKDKRFKQLCASLQADPGFFEDRPILAQADGTIYAGNMRYRAAEHLGWDLVPARLGQVPEQQAKERGLRDNNAYGEWQEDELAALLVELQQQGSALDLLGFPDEDLARLLDSVGALGDTPVPEPQLDRAAELQAQWGTALGQLWVIPSATAPGRAHRLLCGDSTDAATVARLMDGARADVLLTDPPYGMGLDTDFSGMESGRQFMRDKGIPGGRRYARVTGDERPFDARPTIALFDDPSAQFWFGADYYASTLPDPEHTGAWLVWDKRLDESADRMYGSCFELIWAKQRCRREVLRYKWAGVFGTEQEPERRRFHPTQKPSPLLAALVQRTTGLVVDPFTGVGSTLVACEAQGRIGYGCELSAEYVAVALQRLADLGLRPERADG